VTGAETQLLLLRALALLLLYSFLGAIALVTWLDLKASDRSGRPAAARRADGPRLIVLDAAASDRPAGQAMVLDAVSGVGRDLDNEVVLNDATVSARHAVVLRRDGSWWVEDLGSTNGTWLNARRLEPELPALLRSGDVLQFGAVRLRLVSPEAE
jgi:hypothetical protein